MSPSRGALGSCAAAELGRGPGLCAGPARGLSGFLGQQRLFGGISGARVRVLCVCVCLWLPCVLPGLGTGRPCVCWNCVRMSVLPVSVLSVSGGPSEVKGEGKSAGEKGNTRALIKGCLYVCMCAHPAEVLRASLPRRQGRSCQIFCLWVGLRFSSPFFPLSPFLFRFSSPLFLDFTFLPAGAGVGRDSASLLWWPGRPWGTILSPADGAAIWAFPAAETLLRGELLKGERVCLGSPS